MTAEIVIHIIRKADQLKCNRTKFCKDVANNFIGLALYFDVDEELVLPGENEKKQGAE